MPSARATERNLRKLRRCLESITIMALSNPGYKLHLFKATTMYKNALKERGESPTLSELECDESDSDSSAVGYSTSYATTESNDRKLARIQKFEAGLSPPGSASASDREYVVLTAVSVFNELDRRRERDEEEREERDQREDREVARQRHLRHLRKQRDQRNSREIDQQNEHAERRSRPDLQPDVDTGRVKTKDRRSSAKRGSKERRGRNEVKEESRLRSEVKEERSGSPRKRPREGADPDVFQDRLPSSSTKQRRTERRRSEVKHEPLRTGVEEGPRPHKVEEEHTPPKRRKHVSPDIDDRTLRPSKRVRKSTERNTADTTPSPKSPKSPKTQSSRERRASRSTAQLGASIDRDSRIRQWREAIGR